MRVQWTPGAAEDLAAIRRYIALYDPRAAGRVVRLIVEAVDELGRFPRRGRDGRVAGTRELVLPGLAYVIGYRVDRSFLAILAVRHAARRWPRRL